MVHYHSADTSLADTLHLDFRNLRSSIYQFASKSFRGVLQLPLYQQLVRYSLQYKLLDKHHNQYIRSNQHTFPNGGHCHKHLLYQDINRKSLIFGDALFRVLNLSQIFLIRLSFLDG